jgi:hypothetical protein
MLEILALPSMLLTWIVLRSACRRLRIPTVFAPALGASLAGVVTLWFVHRFGFPDHSRSGFGLSVVASIGFALIYLVLGLVGGTMVGLTTAALLQGFPKSRPDALIPWKLLGIACCFGEFTCLSVAAFWLVTAYLKSVHPYLGVNESVDGKLAYDNISFFVIVDFCFVFIPLMFGARLLAFAAAWCFYNERRRQSLITFPARLPTESKSAGLVFLRSFRSGRLRRTLIRGNNPFVTWFCPWHPVYFQRWIGETYDEMLRPHVERSFGSFTAIADPKGHLPNLGAESTYTRDEQWRTTIADMIGSCRAVILLEGATEGLHWELSYVRQQVKACRVFLTTLSPEFPRGRKSWDAFQQLLLRAGFPGVQDPGPGAVVGFDNEWHPVRLIGNAPDCEAVVKSIVNWIEQQS